ncbi:MAG TPA: pyridoxamine 5'-phosphate oxidase family protein [Candidatus Nitrosopolaris sp.]|nr:pyridoxamine 5'-phosphate oxidase family protein [Candidatus Nitrosopolaris sp.]
MEIPELIKNYLQEVKVMQLATTRNNQPWACSVHFVFDDKFNLYWMSTKERRHSREIIDNNLVAATIPIKYPVNPLVGISVEGGAEIVDRLQAQDLIKLYDDRFGLSDKFKSDYFMGTQAHELFKLTPRLYVLYDEINFLDNPRQEWRPAGNP